MKIGEAMYKAGRRPAAAARRRRPVTRRPAAAAKPDDKVVDAEFEEVDDEEEEVRLIRSGPTGHRGSRPRFIEGGRVAGVTLQAGSRR